MKSILKRSVWRKTVLIAYTLFGAWLFQWVEKTSVPYCEMSAKLLKDLHQEMSMKHNIAMSQSEFTEFAKDAYNAVKIGAKVDWTFLNATTFVFSALTTVGT